MVKQCVICETKFEGFGNNPEPLYNYDDGQCCDQCNTNYVVPARIAMYIKSNHNGKFD
jgi:hypothetical protein